MHWNRVARFAQIAALGLLICSIALGQSQTGSLSGTILDSQNAGIPGAEVDATLVASGVTLHTVSNDAGLYVFPNLPPGIWTISVEKPGFKKLVRSNIEIFIAQRQTLDLPLEVEMFNRVCRSRQRSNCWSRIRASADRRSLLECMRPCRCGPRVSKIRRHFSAIWPA